MTEHSREHLTELEIYELATGGAAATRSEGHVEACEGCAAAVAATRRLVGAVERLDANVEAPVTLEERLARRLADAEGGSRPRSPWLRAAAAVVLFVAGAGAHAVWTGTVDRPVAVTAPVPPVLAAQQAGTEYVAAIARLVADSSEMTDAERRLGRDVGLAAMVGAAYELRLLSPGDGATEEIHRVTETTWTGTGER